MSGFLGSILLFLFAVIVFVLLPIGLMKPQVFASWFGESISRSGVMKYFGVTALVTITGATVLVPADVSQDSAPVPVVAQLAEVLDATDTQEPKVVAETKIITETEKIPFETEKTFSDEYQNGTTTVLTRGVNGARTITYDVSYEDGEEVGRTETSNTVTTPPVSQVVAHGTYVQPVPVAPQPVAAAQEQVSNCDPNYTPCIPYSSTDLDCGDIGISVRVVGSDPHGFDRDNDGLGCESYR